MDNLIDKKIVVTTIKNNSDVMQIGGVLLMIKACRQNKATILIMAPQEIEVRRKKGIFEDGKLIAVADL